jgi:hypothetical protein
MLKQTPAWYRSGTNLPPPTGVLELGLSFHCHLPRKAVNAGSGSRLFPGQMLMPAVRVVGPVTSWKRRQPLPRAALTPRPGWAKTGASSALLIRFAGDARVTLRSATKTLLVLALALPVAQAALAWVAGLLRSMGDAAGAAVVGHVGTACQVVWALSLVGLVIVLALVVLNEKPTDE